jgi:phosphonate transport system substrate-binding protein
MGYSISAFHEVSPTDASAAVTLYVAMFKEKIEKRLGKEIIFKSSIYNSIKEMKDALAKNEVDLLSITISEYYELRKSFKITPYLAASDKNDAFEQYCILRRNDSGISKIEDLKNKILSLPVYRNHPMLEEWLINFCAKNKLGTVKKMFSQIKSTEKESNAIYDVFFKKADCAVVRKSVFDVIRELNPQIKNSISAFIYSPPVVLVFSAANDNSNKELMTTILDETRNLELTSSGKNILSIFKAKRFVKIDEADLKTGLDILNENNSFKKPTTKTKNIVR